MREGHHGIAPKVVQLPPRRYDDIALTVGLFVADDEIDRALFVVKGLYFWNHRHATTRSGRDAAGFQE